MLWTTFVVAGAVVVSPLLELDDWFATTQTKEKKASTLLEKKCCINNPKISKLWEGENEPVCYHQHLHLELLLVCIAAIISQTQWMLW